ncbi:hypothetical protein EYC80_005127 [Monilinia laxa]|uniref:Uncharacterized protein n=1 Tax=Monilinia laxa TaxID=61186 RepID=A0A5N6KIZ3_MONLA|nr:hypothetical protein EYC80_005127 [Monilinia laxa]
MLLQAAIVSPTMYSDSTEEWATSSQGSGSSDLFPIYSPCTRVDLLPGAHAPRMPSSVPFVSNLPFDPFCGHSTSSSSSPALSSSSSASPLPQFVGFPPSEGSSPMTQQSFSLHHSLSSASSPSPSIVSLHIPTFLFFSRSSSVAAEDGTQTISPKQPVVYKQTRLFRYAKKKPLGQLWSQLAAEEAVLMARANIVTPERPFKEISMISTSESEGEAVAPSPLSDPFICSPTPFVYSPSPSPSPSPFPSPLPPTPFVYPPSPSPLPQNPQRKRGRFIDARPPHLTRNMMQRVIYDSSSTDDDTDSTDYPSSLDEYPESERELETIPEQSWIQRHQKTIKKVATWGLIAAAIMIPKMMWQWVAGMIHVLVLQLLYYLGIRSSTWSNRYMVMKITIESDNKNRYS